MNVSLHYGPTPMNTSLTLSPWHLFPPSLPRMFVQSVEVKCICDLASGRPRNRKLMEEQLSMPGSSYEYGNQDICIFLPQNFL